MISTWGGVHRYHGWKGAPLSAVNCNGLEGWVEGSDKWELSGVGGETLSAGPRFKSFCVHQLFSNT